MQRSGNGDRDIIPWVKKLSTHGCPPMSLSANDIACLEAFFATKRGRFSMRKQVQIKLRDFFIARVQTLSELPVVVPSEDRASPAWKEQWESMGGAAGLDISDAQDLFRFISGGTASSTGPDSGRSVADTLFQLMDERGVTISAEVKNEAAAMLSASSAGDVKAQSTCVVAVWVLLTGESPGGEEVEWWLEQYEANRAGDGKIDCRRHAKYAKLLKNSNVPTLERAIRTDAGWAAWKPKVVAKLQSVQLPLAATRFMCVCSKAERMFLSSTLTQRRYLMHYFLVEYMGLGMPEEWGNESAFVTMSPGSERQMNTMMYQSSVTTDYDTQQVNMIAEMQVAAKQESTVDKQLTEGGMRLLGVDKQAAAPSEASLLNLLLQRLSSEVAQQQQAEPVGSLLKLLGVKQGEAGQGGSSNDARNDYRESSECLQCLTFGWASNHRASACPNVTKAKNAVSQLADLKKARDERRQAGAARRAEQAATETPTSKKE